jgi:hypothetical protein
MRTTVTLDPDVAERLARLAHARRAPFKQILNEILRRGLAGQEAAAKARPFSVRPHRSGLRPGVDALRLNQLADELEAQDFRREASR